MSGPSRGDRVYIVDANNLTHKIFHGVPRDGHEAPDGRKLNAVIGWVRTLRKLRQTQGVRFMVPVFDGAGPTWRHEMLPDYKSGRHPHDQDLTDQWPLVRELLDALGLGYVQVDSTEADDIIATLVDQAVALELEVIVMSSDKDLHQLIQGPDRGPGSVRQRADLRGDWSVLGPEHVRDKFGCAPARFGDLLALAGDRDDGIPGVPGFGFKTAASLLERYGDLETVLRRYDFNKSKRVRDLLSEHAESVRLYRKLVELHRVELPDIIGNMQSWVPRCRDLHSFFAQFGYPRFEAAVDAYQE